MKKLLSIACVAICMAACSENAGKEESSTTTQDATTTTNSEADKRAKEIADSTKMLDKKLADPNDPTTPDSLK
ncbi:MAG: hypothetical protein H7Y86_05645 [Rhizobacter sp.]|nr:hypothetical protein [Ferruginibacter sp.]